MFDKLFTNFKTEKELILHIIENYSNKPFSQLYDSLARKEWKEKYYDDSTKYQVYRWDNWLMRDLAIFSDDEDIIRALHAIRYAKILRSDSNRKLSIFVNVNLPDDIFEHYLIINDDDIKQLARMSKVKYKINGEKRNRLINSMITDLISLERKKKEDKTKDKLKAFLITAAATKSVLTGKSIDDVVDASITEDVDNDVLDYMTKLFGDKK
tara:strand:- start:716 stop:1348 length:633 start_codon:yes stop_codon:yes gene_type:complete